VDSEKIIAAVEGVTGKWAKQRRAEERRASAAGRRHHALVRSTRVTIKEVAYEVMPAAYMKASNNNKYPAHARQVMYAARGPIQEETGEQLDDQYFTQTLLPNYLLEHPTTTGEWDVVFDARGNFQEPHTGVTVPLGTLDVRSYLQGLVKKRGRRRRRGLFPTHGPTNRFSAVLFVEKEGFLPLFRQALLAQRFDVAIMSTKGVSVVAARALVDDLSGRGVRCLVLRDFDKAGFTIVKSLKASGRRYTFRHRPLVVDLGLRLADVQENGLEAEDVFYGRSDPAGNLEDNGATPEEVEFLCPDGQEGNYTGSRVELNAFTSEDLLRWAEGKLKSAGVKKIVPGEGVLAEAYRLAYRDRLMRRGMLRLRAEAEEAARAVPLPTDLAESIGSRLKQAPQMPWDEALARRAARDIQQAESP
jgi:hypothetical protein